MFITIEFLHPFPVHCILSHAVLPGRYFYHGGNPIMSVNGSSENGNCSLIGTTCNDPQLMKSSSMDPLQEIFLILSVLLSLPVTP